MLVKTVTRVLEASLVPVFYNINQRYRTGVYTLLAIRSSCAEASFPVSLRSEATWSGLLLYYTPGTHRQGHHCQGHQLTHQGHQPRTPAGGLVQPLVGVGVVVPG